MNEPMIRIDRDQDGRAARRFAEPHEPGAAGHPAADRAALRLRWFGAAVAARGRP